LCLRQSLGLLPGLMIKYITTGPVVLDLSVFD
jgi:hypothetical protein